MEKYNQAISDGVLSSDEMEDILLDNGVSAEALKKQQARNAKKAERLLKNKEMCLKLLSKAKWLSKQLSNLPVIGTVFDEVGELCDLISDKIQGRYENIPLATIIMVLATLIYLVNPFDLVPDSIPFIGIVDDVALLTGTIAAVGNDLRLYRKWKEDSAEEQE